MSKYSVNLEYVILDENSDMINYFDTLEEAEEYIEQLENSE